MPWKIPLCDLDIGEEEQQAIAEVLATRWLSMGPRTEAFEQHFAAFLGVPYAVAVSSGTAALHLALLALRIGPGDEVIVPAMTFVASVNAILYVGARPVFADITSLQDFSIAPQAIQRALTPATKAVIVVHYGGYPADMAAIKAAIGGRAIALVEDVAHAPGAQVDGQKLGTIGDVGCFSFFANKNLTTGEGGMLVTSRPEIYERARRLRSHGMTTLTWDRHRGHALGYDVVDLGFNYRMSELHAALGLVQLQKLPRYTRTRKWLTEQYHQHLRFVEGLDVPFERYRGEPSFHLLPVVLQKPEQREQLMRRLATQGIQTSVHYPAVHTFQLYRSLYQCQCPLPLTEMVAQRELTLPLYPGMREEHVTYVCKNLQKALQEL